MVLRHSLNIFQRRLVELERAQFSETGEKDDRGDKYGINFVTGNRDEGAGRGKGISIQNRD
jgi:hypothetical protein